MKNSLFRERELARSRNYYWAHRDQRIAYQHRRKAEQFVKQWQAKHPDSTPNQPDYTPF
jgi:hypothetical protein